MTNEACVVKLTWDLPKQKYLKNSTFREPGKERLKMSLSLFLHCLSLPLSSDTCSPRHHMSCFGPALDYSKRSDTSHSLGSPPNSVNPQLKH